MTSHFTTGQSNAMKDTGTRYAIQNHCYDTLKHFLGLPLTKQQYWVLSVVSLDDGPAIRKTLILHAMSRVSRQYNNGRKRRPSHQDLSQEKLFMHAEQREP